MMPEFATLEAQSAKLRKQVESLPPDQLTFSPTPASWSALHVLEHLIQVEAAYVCGLEENLVSLNVVTWKDRLGALAVQIAMRLPTRVKTPGSAAAVTLRVSGDLLSLMARWEAVRSDLRARLNSLTLDQMRAGLFRHPVAGWMTAAQGLSFLSAHLIHHRYQLRRLESAYGSKMQTSRKLR